MTQEEFRDRLVQTWFIDNETRPLEENHICDHRKQHKARCDDITLYECQTCGHRWMTVQT